MQTSFDIDDGAVMLYGFPCVDGVVDSSGAINNAVIRYGAQFAVDDVLPSNGQQSPSAILPSETNTISREQRDQWWKWALGAGVVTAVAYMLYKSTTMQSEAL